MLKKFLNIPQDRASLSLLILSSLLARIFTGPANFKQILQNMAKIQIFCMPLHSKPDFKRKGKNKLLAENKYPTGDVSQIRVFQQATPKQTQQPGTGTAGKYQKQC